MIFTTEDTEDTEDTEVNISNGTRAISPAAPNK
jgi:hypothetical protein